MLSRKIIKKKKNKVLKKKDNKDKKVVLFSENGMSNSCCPENGGAQGCCPGHIK